MRAALQVSQGGPAISAATLPSFIWVIQKVMIVHLVRSPLTLSLAISMDRT